MQLSTSTRSTRLCASTMNDKILCSLNRDALLRLDGSPLCESVYDGFRDSVSRDGSLVLGPNGWTPKPRSYLCTRMLLPLILCKLKPMGRASGHTSNLDGRGLLRLDGSSTVHLDYSMSSTGAPRTHGWQERTARSSSYLCMWIKQQAAPPAPRRTERDAPAFNTVSFDSQNFP